MGGSVKHGEGVGWKREIEGGGGGGNRAGERKAEREQKD